MAVIDEEMYDLDDQPEVTPYLSEDVSEDNIDDEERELERLVFGDADQWLKDLRDLPDQNGRPHRPVVMDVDREDGDELSNVKDDSLFFLDAGPAERNQLNTVRGGIQKDELGAALANAEDASPVWFDSDDERVVISLADDSRLRKLRKTEAEDVVDGAEYVRRLRLQFQKLHPPPAWAMQDAEKIEARKRRQTSLNGDLSADEDDLSIASDEEEDLNTRPLADVLNNVSWLTPPASASSRLRLRPSVIELQRLKDVGGSQPAVISALAFHPTLPMLMVSAGTAGLISLYHISPSIHSSSAGKTTTSAASPLLTNLHARGTSLSTALFAPALTSSSSSASDVATSSSSLPDPGNLLFSGHRRRYLYDWNLQSGRVTKLCSPLMLGPSSSANSSSTATLTSKGKIPKRTLPALSHFKASPCGRYIAIQNMSKRRSGGEITIISRPSLHWLCDARVEGQGGIADYIWTSTGEVLIVISKAGQCIEYSPSQARVLLRFTDDGGVGLTTAALSTTTGSPTAAQDRYLAIGSTSGIINIYDRSSRVWTKQRQIAGQGTAEPNPGSEDARIEFNPHPLKTLTNLTTPVSVLAFSPDAQVLAVASRWKRDAVRLIHLASGGTVYPNWPSAGTPLGRVSAMAWGAGASNAKLVLAIGNEAGRVRVWEVRG